MDAATKNPSGGDDELWLGPLLDRFVAAIADGREPDVASALVERPDLAAEIKESARLAQTIAPSRPARRPTIGGYAITGELGRGGMGNVFVAEHARLGRRVALKVLPGRFAADGAARERFLREARAIARLDHERIVRVFEVGEDDGTPYYAMELVDGDTLSAVLETLRALRIPCVRLTSSDLARAGACAREIDRTYLRCIARIALDVAEALAHAHAQGVIHRDLKPGNVMLRRDGRAQLFDFGLASVDSEQSLTQSGLFVGTPHYASPEQAGGTSELDGRSDVYSLGATLYELATLERPFRAATTAAVLLRVQNEEPPRPSSIHASIPRDLETIITTAMAKDRERRYLSPSALAADLAAFLEGRPIDARPVGPIARFALRVRRNPLASALVAGLVAAPTLLFLQQRAANVVIRAAHAEAEAALAVDAARDEFLTDMFSAAAPGEGGRDVRVVDVLARAEAALAPRFAELPAVRAALASTIARTYEGLGLMEDALRVRNLELDATRARFGSTSAETLELAARRCKTQVLSDPQAALVEIEAALAGAPEALGPTHPTVLAAEHARLGALHRLARFDEMLESSERLIARLEPLPERDDELWLDSRHLRNCALLGLDRAQDAVSDEAAVLRESEQRFGAMSILTLEYAETQASLLAKLGRFDEALAAIEPFTAVAEDLFGEGDTRFLEHLHLLARLFAESGDLDTAQIVQSRSLELAERHLAGEGWVSAQIRRQAASLAARRGQFAEAERILRGALEAVRAAPGDRSAEPELVADLAHLLETTGRSKEAAELRGLR